MSNLREVYYCKHCKHVVEVVQTGGGSLTCCGEPMKHLQANTTDAANEKHVPVIEDLGDSIKVTVGSVEHPMTDEHYIVFIEVLTKKKVLRKELKPGKEPHAKFKVKMEKVLEVREFCNLHMLWSTKVND